MGLLTDIKAQLILISAKIIAAPATEAKQDDIISDTGDIKTAAEAIAALIADGKLAVVDSGLAAKFSATPGASTPAFLLCGQQVGGTVTPILVDATGAVVTTTGGA